MLNGALKIGVGLEVQELVVQSWWCWIEGVEKGCRAMGFQIGVYEWGFWFWGLRFGHLYAFHSQKNFRDFLSCIKCVGTTFPLIFGVFLSFHCVAPLLLSAPLLPSSCLPLPQVIFVCEERKRQGRQGEEERRRRR